MTPYFKEPLGCEGSQHDTLTQALNDAATSLETISRLAGKAAYPNGDETCMGTFPEVRGYATSRASVARAALSATQSAQAARPDTFHERNAKFREENWQIRFDAAVEARRQAQEQLYAERERHSAVVQALKQELSRATTAKAAQGESDVATWLWLRFADYCRKQGMNPHHQNDLFAIVHDLRAMLTSSPTPPAQQKGGEA